SIVANGDSLPPGKPPNRRPAARRGVVMRTYRRSRGNSLPAAWLLRRRRADDMLGTMSNVTRILSAVEAGDPLAAATFLPLVYRELRRLAAEKMAQENPGQTLQATALVHEAYLRLVGPYAERDSNSAGGETGSESRPTFNNRGHFFAAAAEAMRRILIDQARR